MNHSTHISTSELSDWIQQGIQGQVVEDETAVYTHSFDYGRRIQKRPYVLVQTTCEADVQHCLSVSRATNIPVKVRGSGHSFNGQSLSDGGILLHNTTPEAQFQMVDSELVEVSARTTWYLLEKGLNVLGRSAPVLNDYLHLSIGGTLSVGGYGVRSSVYGAQADQVKRLRLILPNREAVWCSATENPSLFRYSLGTLGQIGILEKVVLQTIPHRRQCRLFTYVHKNLNDLVHSMRWMQNPDATLPDFFHAVQLGGEVLSTYGREYLDGVIERNKWHPQLMPESPIQVQSVDNYPFWSHQVQEQWISRFDGTVRIWSDYFFDFENFRVFAEYVQNLSQQPDKMPYVWGIYILGTHKTKPTPFPFVPSSLPTSPFVCSIGIYHIIPENNVNSVQKIQDVLEQLLDKCISLGGRPYLYGTYPWTPQRLSQTYGEDYTALLKLKQELDPQNLVNPGVFPLAD